MKDKDRIPKKTIYCYILSEGGKMDVCPYWKQLNKKDKYGNNVCYCSYLKQESYEYDPFNLIWDMCKECGVNDEFEYEENE